MNYYLSTWVMKYPDTYGTVLYELGVPTVLVGVYHQARITGARKGNKRMVTHARVHYKKKRPAMQLELSARVTLRRARREISGRKITHSPYFTEIMGYTGSQESRIDVLEELYMTRKMRKATTHTLIQHAFQQFGIKIEWQ